MITNYEDFGSIVKVSYTDQSGFAISRISKISNSDWWISVPNILRIFQPPEIKEEYISEENPIQDLLNLEIVGQAEISEYENLTKSTIPDYEEQNQTKVSPPGPGAEMIENDLFISDPTKSDFFVEMTKLEEELFLAKQ